MKICTATLKSTTPYSQSRMHRTPLLEKETWEEWEERTWRERMHRDTEGNVYIPPMAFKQALDTACKKLGIQIPGRGKATYTQVFLGGVLVMDMVSLGVRADQVKGEWINANADGRRGSGKRVPRCYPVIPAWEITIKFYILDEAITEKVFDRVLIEAGKFVGVGRFRPEKGGFFGRFIVQRTAWEQVAG